MTDRLVQFDGLSLWGNDEDPGVFQNFMSRAAGKGQVREPAFEWIIRNEVAALHSPLLCDIGANIGYYTQVMAQEARGENWRILAVEPDAVNFGYLERNIAELGDRCDIACCAISDHTGMIGFQQSEFSNCGRANNAGAHSHRPNGTGVEVECWTFPSLLSWQVLGVPNFTKMDIEGGELQFFRGARELLVDAKAPCKILVEVHQGEWRANPRVFRNELEFLLANNWRLRYVVSAGEYPSKKLNRWTPFQTIKQPAQVRQIFAEFPLDEALHYLSVRDESESANRTLRAFMLEKKEGI